MAAPELQPPDLTLFSYTANGTGVTQAATYDALRGLSLQRTDSASGGDHHAFRGKAIPAGGSWEAIMRMKMPSVGSGDAIRRGFTLHESATGKSVMLGMNMQGGANIVAMISSSLDNAFAGTQPYNFACAGPFPEWFRWTWDGTNYKGFVSYDGQATWEQMCSFTPTTYFTVAPNKIGVTIESWNSITLKPYLVVISYDDPDTP